MTLKPTKKGIATAPQTTGVYIFLNGALPVYIGKAVNFKARLASHLENARFDAREEAIFKNSTAIKIIPAESEFKALLLEASLIKKFQPRYNKIWKDDKSYLYISIDMREKYPRIRLARKHDLEIVKHQAPSAKRKTFGPFPSTRVVEKILREVRRVIPCHSASFGGKPCFHSKIGLCRPCPNSIEKLAKGEGRRALELSYRKNIRAITKILEGKTDAVLKNLYKELKILSRQEKYEDALTLRNRILLFEKFVSEKSGIEREGIETFGVGDPRSSLLGVLKKFFPHLAALRRIECYDISNISQRHATASMVVAMNGFIDKSQYRKFRIRSKTARSDFEMLREVMERRFARSSPPLQGGARGGNSAPTPPISPSGRGRNWQNPDLVIVDGGAPQVRTLQKVFAEQNIAIPVIGIAKNPDRLVIPTSHLAPRTSQFKTLRLPSNHPGFNLVRRLRDEAHRFSKKYHLILRSRALLG